MYKEKDVKSLLSMEHLAKEQKDTYYKNQNRYNLRWTF